MRKLKFLIPALLCAALCPAALAQDAPDTVASPTSATIPNDDPAIAEQTLEVENYRLSPNDLITVKVFQEDNLTTEARLSADGSIAFPLIGQVKVAGQTTRQAAQMIAHLLDAKYIVNPQVSITVLTYARRGFTVLGQVLKAGSYNMQFQDSIDLLEAIGTAGGYTRLANPAKITIKRRVGDRDQIFQVNGKDLANGNSAKAFRVKPGDMITVGERIF
jgi:polysaccharide export outer membrane protein